jgi:hypothetical protein
MPSTVANKDLEHNAAAPAGGAMKWYQVKGWSTKKRIIVFGGTALVLIAVIVGAAVGSENQANFCDSNPEAASCGGCEGIAGGIYC